MFLLFKETVFWVKESLFCIVLSGNLFETIIDDINVNYNVVSRGQRHMPHRHRNIKFIAKELSQSNNFA